MTEPSAIFYLAADTLDDAERLRIANENRFRQLTRTEPDSDGVVRGIGFSPDDKQIQWLTDSIRKLGEVEHIMELNLQRLMRAHPLGPWIASQKGVGEKQFARLLASIGDPYWNGLYDRPRTVSELWAFCGLHTVPAGHAASDTHGRAAGGGSDATNSDQTAHETLANHVAARRQKGRRANWSTTAKSRVYLISTSMLKAGNRDVYDRRKTTTEGRLHAAPCVRCGPAGQPAQAQSPWSDGHRHADALRIQGKELLKQLWREARRLHGEQEATAA